MRGPDLLGTGLGGEIRACFALPLIAAPKADMCGTNAPAALINKSLAEANKPGFQQTSKLVRWRPCLE